MKRKSRKAREWYFIKWDGEHSGWWSGGFEELSGAKKLYLEMRKRDVFKKGKIIKVREVLPKKRRC